MASRTSHEPSVGFGYVFPAIRGVQAGREYYVSMCPLRLIPKIFLFNEEELVPELRAQRVLNRARVPEIARYMLNNLGNYTFSALTASIDGATRFREAAPETPLLGSLCVSMDARFVINDGQHRRAGIEAAIREQPELADESIAVVFFVDVGLDRCQQMFADLNRHAIRPSTSLGVLYDQRDVFGGIVKSWLMQDRMFRDLTEMERSTLSPRSRKLFTLSALYHASLAVLAGIEVADAAAARERLGTFWSAVAAQFPIWSDVAAGRTSAAEVRRDWLSSHGIALHAVGRAGGALLTEHPRDWKGRLKRLRTIDWARSNSALWEGRATLGGRVSKSSSQVTLVTNVIKNALGVSLTPDEQRLEDAYQEGVHVAAAA
jgi:DNA sulfur modification protein DndB